MIPSNAIERLKPCKCFDIPADSALSNYKNLLLKKFHLGKDLPDPNLIVGAGHGCHLSMLSAKHARTGKTIVLEAFTLDMILDKTISMYNSF